MRSESAARQKQSKRWGTYLSERSWEQSAKVAAPAGKAWQSAARFIPFAICNK